MADKPTYVDLIGAATRQNWHRPGASAIMRDPLPELEPEKERSRLSHWPPQRLAMWRLDILTPWKKRRDPRG